MFEDLPLSRRKGREWKIKVFIFWQRFLFLFFFLKSKIWIKYRDIIGFFNVILGWFLFVFHLLQSQIVIHMERVSNCTTTEKRQNVFHFAYYTKTGKHRQSDVYTPLHWYTQCVSYSVHSMYYTQ